MANIKVAVRVRPISSRELNLTGSEIVVRTELNEISLTNLKVSSSKAGDSRERTRRYGFDYCFDSSDPAAENYASQAKIYETLGHSVLDALFNGYNSCLVAYGQSASGKTYTMMGSKEDPGLTPRLCEGLFARIGEEEKNEKTYHMAVSYLEIYNDRVRDLLKPSASTGTLKVREHPRSGPYVQGLTQHVVRGLGALMSYVDEGTRARKTASTLQNASSSRSHALLTVSLRPDASCVTSERPGASSSASAPVPSSGRRDAPPRAGSKLHLVDLAGSESAATCGGVHRLKEGANINKSLVALGNVISALAERGSAGSGPGRRFIPYRDSSLTWLLKDALGGNAATIMLATISPASGSYNETAHTLRFAQRAQSVVNRPVVNEDPVARIIRELRDEVARLKCLLLEKNLASQGKSPCYCVQAQEPEVREPDRGESSESEVSSTRRCDGEGQGGEQERGERDREVRSIRRFNSSDSLTTCEIDPPGPLRRFGSCEFPGSADRLAVRGFNRAKVAVLNDEEDAAIDETSEPVFVDIPTLVAVLIKPDDSLREGSSQIEEICGDEAAEGSIDAEFADAANERDAYDAAEKPEGVDRDDCGSSIASNCAADDLDAKDARRSSTIYSSCGAAGVPRARSKDQLLKQDSIDVAAPSASSNLRALKRFGSVEGLQKGRESFAALQRSHTSLDRRAAAADRAKRLNNIREIEGPRANGKPASVGALWRGIVGADGKDQPRRKGSNDSDRSLRDANALQSACARIRSAARKPSLESLKRKTSKDSSSSSSKDEQILITGVAREKLLRRKGSLDQEPPTPRAHTPIQRTKRAEIVAAVTERLYASRRHVEEPAMSSTPGSGTRSPPEGTDVKLATTGAIAVAAPFTPRSKLQEISRKMLAKRRRVCADTQTENLHTVRVKDTASLTDETKVVCQDAAVLTECHENCEAGDGGRVPVLRVKEIATLTDRPRTGIVRYKDAESLADDLDLCEYDAHSPRNDSGILSDDARNHAESNGNLFGAGAFDACRQGDGRVLSVDRSTNTTSSTSASSATNTVSSSPTRTSASQTPPVDVAKRSRDVAQCTRLCCGTVEESCQTTPVSIPMSTPVSAPVSSSNEHCCRSVQESVQGTHASNVEKNIISISFPDMISITIESPNALESKIALTDESEPSGETIESRFRDSTVQTDGKIDFGEKLASPLSPFSFKDFVAKPGASQADSRVFRIENIFDDPRTASRTTVNANAAVDSTEDGSTNKSVTFTNSLGTSFVPETRETATEVEKSMIPTDGPARESQRSRSFIEAFVSRRHSHGSARGERSKRDSSNSENARSKWTYPPTVLKPSSRNREFETILSAWQRRSNANADSSTRVNDPVQNFKGSDARSTAPVFNDAPNDVEPSNAKPSSPVTKMDPKVLTEPEYNFSDDSLDYNEANACDNRKAAKCHGAKDRECRDNPCPPDVVAHTKKEAAKPSGRAEASNVERFAAGDFDDSRVEFPRNAPTVGTGTVLTRVHDYKSLILGERVLYTSDRGDEKSDREAASSRSSGVGKKKVSFSGVTVAEDENQRTSDECTWMDCEQAPTPELKSIIKKKKKTKKVNARPYFSVTRLTRDEMDDSVREDGTGVVFDSQFRDAKASNEKLCELDSPFPNPENGRCTESSRAFAEDSTSKKVRFSNEDTFEDTFEDTCSDSYSDGNTVSDDDGATAYSRRNILQEYLDEAVTFMRNMNSVNEYTRASKVFENGSSRGKRRVGRRRACRSLNQDYIEYEGRRVSLKDDTDEYLKDDEDIAIPTESYQRCLRGIERLESCIEKVGRHDELLRERYDIRVEPTSAKHDLATPSLVSTLSRTDRDARAADPRSRIDTIDARRDAQDAGASRDRVDDLEKRIFDQLMTVVESRRCRRQAPSCTTQTPDGSVTYCKQRARCGFPRATSASRTTRSDPAFRRVRDDSAGARDSSGSGVGNNYGANRSSGRLSSKRAGATFAGGIRSFGNVDWEMDEENEEDEEDEEGEEGEEGEENEEQEYGEDEEDLNVSLSIMLGPAASRGLRDRSHGDDGFARRIKDCSPSKRGAPSSIAAATGEGPGSSDAAVAIARPTDRTSHFRDKLKYPGSPRARFLELLNERRRIVESTRGTGAS